MALGSVSSKLEAIKAHLHQLNVIVQNENVDSPDVIDNIDKAWRGINDADRAFQQQYLGVRNPQGTKVSSPV